MTDVLHSSAVRRLDRAGDTDGQVLREHTPKTWYIRFGKRAFDIVLALVALVVLLPVFVVIALSIRLTMGRDVIFRQSRVGLGGQDFTMYKFRTMLHSRRAAQQPFDGCDRRLTHKHSEDPRHTRLGRILRRLSLDEIPQFINVLKGDMSLVGPRPELSTVVDAQSVRSHPRHTVVPGITGYWQVTARNDGRRLHECFDQDLPYLSSVSLSEDLRILLRTVWVLTKRGGR